MTAGHRDAPRSCVICEWVAPPAAPGTPPPPGVVPTARGFPSSLAKSGARPPSHCSFFLNDAAVIDDCTPLGDLETDR